MASMERVATTRGTGSGRWANPLERDAAAHLYGERDAIEVDSAALVVRRPGYAWVQGWLRVDTTTMDSLAAAVADAAANDEDEPTARRSADRDRERTREA